MLTCDVLLELKKKGWYCEECDQSVIGRKQVGRERPWAVPWRVGRVPR